MSALHMALLRLFLVEVLLEIIDHYYWLSSPLIFIRNG